jgi:phage protein D
MARRPYARIIGPSGGDLVSRLGDRLPRLTMTDQAGSESDELVFDVRVAPPFPKGPQKGTRYLADVGWELNAMRLTGIYTVQTHTLSGNAEEGYTMSVRCRSSDFIDTMKKVDCEHFDEMSAGDMFRRIAKGGGMQAIVDEAIAEVHLPYRIRWNQSAVDFATELAEELGATVKLAGGKLVVQARGAGRAAGGRTLPTIVVPFAESYGFDITIESRGRFEEVGGEWFDPLAGIRKKETETSVGPSSVYMPVHPFASQDEAKRAGQAAGREHARKSVSGSFDMAGNPLATAEAPVKPEGFGSEIDSLDLVCSTATHEITFDDDGGWITTVEVESKGDK